MEYAVLFISNFFFVGSRVWQQKNVIGDHFKNSIPTGMVISAFFYFNVAAISQAESGVVGFMCFALGGTLGQLLAMIGHNKWVRRS